MSFSILCATIYIILGDNDSMEAENIQNINNPLVHFETWVSMDDREKEPDENCFMRRQVRFCSQWCLDNLCKYQLYHPIINL